MADDQDGPAAELADTAHDRLVVRELPVALHLDELVDEAGTVVHEMGALGMPGDLGLLPGVQVCVGVPAHLPCAVAQGVDLVAQVIRSGGLSQAGQLVDLGLEVGNRALELKIVNGHAAGIPSCYASANLVGGPVQEKPDSRRPFRVAESGWASETTSLSRSPATWV